ncbi:hypothetical protein [Planctomonas psychrotolerans]|uniref:hypothetical protein n=1 Tax=Planctomonas psychrotolerans TaxID=2528712 RepID=UPI00123867B5|nr:hypothetical protein [Planctomonas psychrotolerans]
MSNIRKLMDDGAARPARTPRAPLDRSDILKAVGAMLLSAVIVGILAAMALVLLTVTDGCGPGQIDCKPTQFAVAFFIALLLPPLVAVIGFLVTAVLLARRRPRPWRASLLAIPVSFVAWVIGAGLAFGAVPGYGVGDYLGVLGTIGG